MKVVKTKAESDFKCMSCNKYIKGKMYWMKHIIQLGVCKRCYMDDVRERKKFGYRR